MATEKKKSLAPVYVLTGVFLFILCAAVCIAALIVPYEKGKTYLGLVFMDQSKIPGGGVAGLNDGLVIKDNTNIDTDPDAQSLSEEGEIIRPVFGEQYLSTAPVRHPHPRCSARPATWSSAPM